MQMIRFGEFLCCDSYRTAGEVAERAFLSQCVPYFDMRLLVIVNLYQKCDISLPTSCFVLLTGQMLFVNWVLYISPKRKNTVQLISRSLC